jgi:hypothetical protein
MITNTTLPVTIGAVGSTGTVHVTSASTISFGKDAESVLDAYDMNQISVEHRVTEFELMKLKDSDVNYADHIKSNLSKMATAEVVKRMTFTKKKEIDADTTSFRGRIYVFTKDELLELIRDASK